MPVNRIPAGNGEESGRFANGFVKAPEPSPLSTAKLLEGQPPPPSADDIQSRENFRVGTDGATGSMSAFQDLNDCVELTDSQGVTYSLTPGCLEQARESGVFTGGHCHSWALAAYNLTGWEIVAFRSSETSNDEWNEYADESEEDDEEHEWEGWVRHFAIRSPSGDIILDIDGAYTEHYIKSMTGWDMEVIETPENMFAEMQDSSETYGRKWQPINETAAESFVQPVFDEL